MRLVLRKSGQTYKNHASRVSRWEPWYVDRSKRKQLVRIVRIVRTVRTVRTVRNVRTIRTVRTVRTVWTVRTVRTVWTIRLFEPVRTSSNPPSSLLLPLTVWRIFQKSKFLCRTVYIVIVYSCARYKIIEKLQARWNTFLVL